MKQLTLLFASMIIFIGCATGGKKSKESSEKHPSIVTEEFVFELDNAPTPQCHASTVAESNGVIVSSWFAGTEEKNKDVGIWVARKVDGKWEAPFEVANGVQEDGTRHPSWNPVLFQPKNGSLMLFYKVGPDPRTWWGLYKTSDDNGLTWSEPHKLLEDILGAIKNQPIQLGNGDILAPSSIEKTGKEWTIHVERSSDGGKTWTTTGSLNNPEKFGAIQPVIYNYGNGKLQMLSRTMNEVITECRSDDYGKTWGEMTAT
jgi:predicted neuraminidase